MVRAHRSSICLPKLEIREYDVIDNEEKFDEMVRITGQQFAPSLRLHMDGMVDKILSDFGVEELVTFLEVCGLEPD